MTTTVDHRRVAVITRVTPSPTRPGAFLLQVRCPICGKKHTHSLGAGDYAPDPDGTYGHRVAHCSTKATRDNPALTDGGYYLADPDDKVPRAVQAWQHQSR